MNKGLTVVDHVRAASLPSLGYFALCLPGVARRHEKEQRRLAGCAEGWARRARGSGTSAGEDPALSDGSNEGGRGLSRMNVQETQRVYGLWCRV